MKEPKSPGPGEWLLWAYIILALGAFTVLAVMAYQNPYLNFDPPITLALQSFRPAWFSILMVAISWPGYLPQAAVLVVLVIVLIDLRGYRWEAVVTLISTISSQILDAAVKIFVHQPRPTPDLVHVVRVLKSYSFPSGHVMYYMGFYAFLWYLAFTLFKPSWSRTFLLFLLGAMIALVGISRVYLGEHWFSDVLGAYLLGSVVLIAAVRGYCWGKARGYASEGSKGNA